MADIGTFTESKNKMVPLETMTSEFEVQKNDSFSLIIEILQLNRFVLKRIVVC